MNTERFRFDIRRGEGFWILHYEEHFSGENGAQLAKATSDAAKPMLEQIFPVTNLTVKENVLHAELHGAIASIANFMVGEFIPMSDLGNLNLAQLIQMLGAAGLKK